MTAFLLFVLSCVDRGCTIGRSPVQEVVRDLLKGSNSMILILDRIRPQGLIRKAEDEEKM